MKLCVSSPHAVVTSFLLCLQLTLIWYCCELCRPVNIAHLWACGKTLLDSIEWYECIYSGGWLLQCTLTTVACIDAGWRDRGIGDTVTVYLTAVDVNPDCVQVMKAAVDPSDVAVTEAIDGVCITRTDSVYTYYFFWVFEFGILMMMTVFHAATPCNMSVCLLISTFSKLTHSFWPCWSRWMLTASQIQQ